MVAWSNPAEAWCSRVFAALPLVLAHVVVPPLSAITGTESVPELNELYLAVWPQRWLKFSFMSKYLFQTNSWSQYSPWCWLSSLFIHSDYEHLFNNLLSLVLEFSSVSAELGPAWTYALFFGGGIISNVPSFVHERQAGSLGRDLKASAEKFTENWAIQNYIGSIVSKGADWIGRALTPSLSCGSSGAIFTLTGVNFAINLKSAWKRIKKAAESGTVPDAVSAISFIAFKTIMPVAATYACIMGEVNALFGQREALPLSKIIFGQRIAHAAHLQGAIFGMVVGMLV